MQGYRSTDPPKTLLEAAAWGNLAAVQRFLAKGARPDQKDVQGWTALHHAVGYGQESGVDVLTSRTPVKGIVEVLLKAGTPLNSLTKAGMTPLMQAIAAQHEDAALWLLTAGADLRTADTVGGNGADTCPLVQPLLSCARPADPAERLARQSLGRALAWRHNKGTWAGGERQCEDRRP